MIQIAKQMNLEFKKNYERKVRLNKRFDRRRKHLAAVRQRSFDKYSSQMIVDPVSLYLFLTLDYLSRVQKRSVKTMTIELSGSVFIDKESILLDEMFEKVIKQFAKHKI